MAEKSAQKNNGNTALAITTNQALLHDILAFLQPKLECIVKELADSKEEVAKCNKRLVESNAREIKLLERINSLESKFYCTRNVKEQVYVIGSSVLREMKKNDIVSSISGGKICDVRKSVCN